MGHFKEFTKFDHGMPQLEQVSSWNFFLLDIHDQMCYQWALEVFGSHSKGQTTQS